MRKGLILCIISCFVTALPAGAAMNFYRTADGQIVIEAETCNDAAHLANFVRVPDDPPDGTDETAVEDTQDEEPQVVTPPPAAGVNTLTEALVGNMNTNLVRPRSNFADISQETEDLLDAADFDERQESLVTFVRDVNWKTGMHITWRDYSFFRRLKMACSGVNQLTKPMRLNLEMYTGSLDNAIDKASNAAVDQLAQAVRDHSFSAMTKLSLVGLAIAIDKENPFLLLAIDEDTYNKLVEMNPRIKELFENMYIFFKIRAVRLDNAYDDNVKDLIHVTELGKGDAFDTWALMAKYALNILNLDRQGKLTPRDEKEIHVWKLESSVHYVREQVRVERRAAQLAAQDPANAGIIREIEAEPKKKPSLDEKAIELLKKSTQDEIKQLIRKYVTK